MARRGFAGPCDGVADASRILARPLNDQWRVILEWTAEGPSRVRVANYY